MSFDEWIWKISAPKPPVLNLRQRAEMFRIVLSAAVAAALVVAGGCGGHGHDHGDHEGHDHGHGHGDGGGKKGWKQSTMWNLKAGSHEWTLTPPEEGLIFAILPSKDGSQDSYDQVVPVAKGLFNGFMTTRKQLSHDSKFNVSSTTLYQVVKHHVHDHDHDHKHDHGDDHKHDHGDGHKHDHGDGHKHDHDDHDHDHDHKHDHGDGHDHDHDDHDHDHDHKHDHGDGHDHDHDHNHDHGDGHDQDHDHDHKHDHGDDHKHDHHEHAHDHKHDHGNGHNHDHDHKHDHGDGHDHDHDHDHKDHVGPAKIYFTVPHAGRYAIFSSVKLEKVESSIAHDRKALEFEACFDGCDFKNRRPWGLTLLGCFIVSLTAFVGVGVLLLNKKLVQSIIDLMISFAAGAMISTVATHLYPEAGEYLAGRPEWELGVCVLAGVVLGMFVEQGCHILLHHNGVEHSHHHIDMSCPANHENHANDTAFENIETPGAVEKPEKPTADAPRISPVAWVVALGDFIHAFVDGILIAIGFQTSTASGWTITLAICLHEVPHRLGDFFVFLKAGMTVKQAALLNFLASLSGVIGAIILLSVGEVEKTTLGYMLGVGSGALLFISLTELLPTMLHEMNLKRACINFFVFSIGAVVVGLTMLNHHHDH